VVWYVSREERGEKEGEGREKEGEGREKRGRREGEGREKGGGRKPDRPPTEISYLHELDGDFDRATRTVSEHPEIWKDAKFREILVKVKSTDLLYDSVKFYLEFAPENVVELLGVVSNRLDPVKVVQLAQKLEAIYIIQPFLEHVQEKNIRELNNVLNELYIEDENFLRLRESIERYEVPPSLLPHFSLPSPSTSHQPFSSLLPPSFGS
jgi:hypothetical protein